MISKYFFVFQSEIAFLSESHGVIHEKYIEDAPPPYENPPDYFSLPKEFIMDPARLIKEVDQKKSNNQDQVVPVHTKSTCQNSIANQNNDVKVDIEGPSLPKINLWPIADVEVSPKALPRKNKKQKPKEENETEESKLMVNDENQCHAQSSS